MLCLYPVCKCSWSRRWRCFSCFLFCVCLTVEGVSYPTGTLLVQHINVVFLSPMGPSWAASAACVSVCVSVCVRQPPLSVSVSDWVCPPLHSDLQKVCVGVCVCVSVPSRRMPINRSSNPPWCTFCRSLWLRADILLVVLIYRFSSVIQLPLCLFFKFTFSCVFVTQPAHSWLPHIPHSNVLP